MAMLRGIKIIDLTSVVFGPYATQLIADLGAEVIKVEPPVIGDVSRYLGTGRDDPTMGSVHLNLNRGKQSIVLDLKVEEDAETLRALIADADVFIHNIRSKAIERLGFGYEACRAIQPKIIYVHATGFNQDGPYGDLQAYDDVIQAATGTTTLLSRVDGDERPRFLPSLIADKVAGMFGAQAILAAIIHQLRTGEGQHVEVPMFECFTSFMMTEHLRDATLVPPIGPPGYPRQLDPTRQPFPTSDGYLAIVPYTHASVAPLMALIGSSEFLDSEAYLAASEKGAGMPLVHLEIARRTTTRTTAEWVQLLADHNIPAMPVRDLADVPEDPHLKATGFFNLREHPDVGPFLEMSPPVKYGAYPYPDLGFAPRLDGNSAQIKATLQPSISS